MYIRYWTTYITIYWCESKWMHASSIYLLKNKRNKLKLSPLSLGSILRSVKYMYKANLYCWPTNCVTSTKIILLCIWGRRKTNSNSKNHTLLSNLPNNWSDVMFGGGLGNPKAISVNLRYLASSLSFCEEAIHHLYMEWKINYKIWNEFLLSVLSCTCINFFLVFFG